MEKIMIIPLQLHRRYVVQLASMMCGAICMAKDRRTKGTADRVLHQLMEHLNNRDQKMISDFMQEFKDLLKRDSVGMDLMKTGFDTLSREFEDEDDDE